MGQEREFFWISYISTLYDTLSRIFELLRYHDRLDLDTFFTWGRVENNSYGTGLLQHMPIPSPTELYYYHSSPSKRDNIAVLVWIRMNICTYLT
jgi:hypothetical protein